MTPQILAAMIVDRTAFDVIYPNVSLRSVDPITGFILAGIARYYQVDTNAEYIHIDTLRDQIIAGLNNPKHAPDVKAVLDIAAKLAPDVSSKNVKEVFRIYKEDALSRQLAATLASTDRTGAGDLMEEYLKLNDVADFEKEPELTALIQERFNKEGLMPILPLCFNAALDGGARKEHHIIIVGRPECYSPDTDVLTTAGWLPFPELTTDHYVAQYHGDTGTINYTQPSRVLDYDVSGNLVHVTSKKKQVDLLVTEEHTLVYRKGGKVHTSPAKSMLWYQGKQHILAGVLGTEDTTELSPHDRLQIAFQADGSYGNPACTGGRTGTIPHRLAFGKARKTVRLAGIVAECGYSTASYALASGKMEHHVHVPLDMGSLSKDFAWVKPATRDVHWLRQFIEELSYWDATRRSATRYKFDTTNKSVADVVQEVCALAGYACFHSEFVDSRKDSYRNIHSLSIRTSADYTDGQAIVSTTVPYVGKVYCCTVDTGMLVVRRNGKVCVSGNSGKSLTCINAAAGLARFGAKGIFFENEDRTDDTRLRFWCNLSGMNKEAIQSNSSLAQERARANGIKNIRVQPLCPGTPGEIKYFVKTEKPDFIVVNQIRNLHVRAGTRTEQLERAATEMRNIGKKYGVLAISVTQAGDSATDKLILDQGDIDGSNTGIPSQGDVILGVGVNPQYEKTDMRHLSTSKNKVGARSRWDQAVRIDRGTSSILEA